MNEKIANNPTFTKLEEEMKNIGCLLRLMPWLLDKEKKLEFKRMKKELEELRNIPDKFNSLYLARGWVYFEGMNSNIVRKCIEFGQVEEIDKGEQELIDFFKGDIRYLTHRLWNISGFNERYNLFQNAYKDYLEGRYYACVPIFLMIIDGAVNQVLKKNNGLFAQDVNLVLYDSVVGHKNGLSSLIKLMSKGRKATTTEPINIPYRNGILHGMDICYDNELVATKALATLFAVAEWIEHFCDCKHNLPDKENKKTIKDIIKKFKLFGNISNELNERNKLLQEWEPRNFNNTNLSTYSPIYGTPEYTAINFMELFKKSNYGKMAEYIIDYSGNTPKHIAGAISTCLKNKKCISYKIINIIDEAPAISEVILCIKIATNNNIQEIETKCRLIYSKDKNHSSPLVRGEKNGNWYIIGSIYYDISNKLTQ